MPVTVYIWENASFVKAISHPGHASMSMTYIDKNGNSVETAYLSWWPGQSASLLKKVPTHDNRTYEIDGTSELSSRARAGLANNTMTPRPGQVQSRGVWIQEPQHKIVLPGRGEPFSVQQIGNPNPKTCRSVGLNVYRMICWWNMFCAAPERFYRYISAHHNCVSVVLSALEAGGIHLFADKKFKRGSYLVPKDILSYLREAEHRMQGINICLPEYLDNIANPDYEPETRGQRRIDKKMHELIDDPLMQSVQVETLGNTGSSPVFDLWSMEDWKAASYVKLGRRKEQVLAIDAYLKEYHQLGVFSTARPFAYHRKVILLDNILTKAHEHMAAKTNSDRGEAVFQLARQAYEMRQRCNDYDDPMQAALQVYELTGQTDTPISQAEPIFTRIVQNGSNPQSPSIPTTEQAIRDGLEQTLSSAPPPGLNTAALQTGIPEEIAHEFRRPGLAALIDQLDSGHEPTRSTRRNTWQPGLRTEPQAQGHRPRSQVISRRPGVHHPHEDTADTTGIQEMLFASVQIPPR